MSYPDNRFTQPDGAASAAFRPVGAAPDFVSPPPPSAPPDSTGTAYHYLATQASTGGDFGLYRLDMGPEPAGPAAHFHRTISESFFVLAGTIRVFDGRQWIDAQPGDYLYVPAGGLHAFRNESGEPASMLLLFTPGAPREAYFEGLPGLGGVSAAERTAFQLRHDSYFV